MTRHRLAVADAAVARMIQDASLEDCRNVAASVAELAASDMDSEPVLMAFSALKAGEFGDSLARSQIGSLVEELDKQAWRLQEEGRDDDYLAAFSKARAASSLWFALGEEPRTAATEATYEAQASLDDPRPVFELVALICETGAR